MDPQSLVIIFRMVERILGVLIGGVLIYCGYRLFLSLASSRGRDRGSGEFSFGGGNKIKLSKVGPGVFFALFGAALIVFSLVKPVSLTISPRSAKATPAPKPGVVAVSEFKFVGAVSVPETDEDRRRMRIETQQDIIALNHARDTSHPGLERAVSRAKLALMEPLWADDWGDIADFRDWLDKGGNPPATVQPAVNFFQQE
ncbi:MAG TPA: hypothetical protein VFQ83_02790 [Candidatus Udaeobacter sp.]|nr:hypothetical protein [Candidatus Udaeobacter sp.]